MASSWFLKLAFKCVDHFAWPLLALGYPLCASVQAIETDSHEETRELISYWILLSLIYLFEYAFTRLLQWFQFWPYMKLIIIFWLIVPGFGRASYVYNNLIRPCISMKQSVICRLNNYWRNFFVEKDNFLQHAERYIKENGTEALEKLIASKNTMNKPNAKEANAIRATDDKEMQQNTMIKPDAEAANAIRATDNKEMQPNTMIKPDAEAANAIRATDNKEMQPNTMIKSNAEAANAIRADDNKEMQPNTMNKPDAEAANAIRATDNKEMQPNTMNKPNAEAAHAIRASDNKEMQLTNGKRLQTEDEDIKDLDVIEKKETPAGKHDIPVMPNLTPSKNASSAMVETKGIAGKDTTDGELPQSSSHKEVQTEWTCALCQVTTTNEKTLNSHLGGRKHRAKCEALKAKNQPTQQKPKIYLSKEELKQKNIINQLNSNAKNGESIVNNDLKGTTASWSQQPSFYQPGFSQQPSVAPMPQLQWPAASCPLPLPYSSWNYYDKTRPAAQVPSVPPMFNGQFSAPYMPQVASPAGRRQAFLSSADSASSVTWYPDSGASHHVTSNSQNIQQVSPFEGPDQIIIGNGKGLLVNSMCSTSFQSPLNSKKAMNKPNAEAANAIRAADNKEMQAANSSFSLLKNTMNKSNADVANAIRATDNKEMQPTNGRRLQTEDEDIKDLEVIEKKETPAGKHDIPVMPNLMPSKNASSAMVETKGIAAKDTAGGELPQSCTSTHKEVQKEWACALCQVTITCEKSWNSHLSGRKHRAKCKALKAKNQPTPQKPKIYLSEEELNQSAKFQCQELREYL